MNAARITAAEGTAFVAGRFGFVSCDSTFEVTIYGLQSVLASFSWYFIGLNVGDILNETHTAMTRDEA
jgi:hypothetical protein